VVLPFKPSKLVATDVTTAQVDLSWLKSDNPKFWNKLGSIAEVATSEIGVGGTVSGNPSVFTDAKFDKGLECNETVNDFVHFPKVFGTSGVGTVEGWYKPHYDNTDAGLRPIFIFADPTDILNYFAVFYFNGLLATSLFVGGNDYVGYFYTLPAFSAEDEIHLGMNYDFTAGVGLKIELFVNNVEIAVTGIGDDQVFPQTANTWGLILGDIGYPGNHIVDNVKLWDYRKRDFADKDVEGTTAISPVDSSMNVYRDSTLLSSIDPLRRTYSDTTVEADTTYVYTIKSENATGEGDPSNAVTIITPSIPDIDSLIRSNLHRPVRKMYIKRRDTDDVFETEWLQINEYKLTNRVTNWGSVTMSIDDYEGRIGAFNCSNLTLTVKNDDGLFNVETDERSLWYEWLNRKFTKIKIDVGYLDADDNEVGVDTIFEGVINKVTINDQQTANMECLSYQTILQKYDISDLSMTGSKTVNAILTLIMNQTKITKFIPYVAPDVAVNATITDTALIEGTYWEVMKDLAFKSNSVPLVYGSSFEMVTRTVTGVSTWDFKGKGSANSDIFKINRYDDEGADRVRVYWLVEGTAIDAISSDATLLKKYLNEPETINLDDVDAGDRQAIADALLAEWENPKPVMEFTTRFLVNQVKPLDIVSTTIEGEVTPSDTFIWGAWTWGDGGVWGKRVGSIDMGTAVLWKVLNISKNINSWNNKVKLEQIV